MLIYLQTLILLPYRQDEDKSAIPVINALTILHTYTKT